MLPGFIVERGLEFRDAGSQPGGKFHRQHFALGVYFIVADSPAFSGTCFPASNEPIFRNADATGSALLRSWLMA